MQCLTIGSSERGNAGFGIFRRSFAPRPLNLNVSDHGAMIHKAWQFLRETGILGNLVSAGLLWALGLLLVSLSALDLFSYTITFTIPVLAVAGLTLTIAGIVYVVYKIVSNPVRQYINVYGYFRDEYRADYFPYLYKDGKYYTKIKKSIEYRIAKNGVTTISPFTFYAYKPRSSQGEEAVRNISVTALVNGQPNALIVDQSKVGNNGYSITIRARKPLHNRDLVSFCVEYEQYGLHALCQEELDKYKKRSDLVDNLRNRLIREKGVEYIYASPSYSRKYVVAVNFPVNYPWRLLDAIDDMAMITLSSKPIDRQTMKKVAHLLVEENRIQLEYQHEFRSAHGHLLLWRPPTKSELLSFVPRDSNGSIFHNYVEMHR